MIRTMLLVASAWTLIAAAPTKYGSLSTPMFQESTVFPEQATASATGADTGFTPAPLPDIEATAPVLRTLGPAQAEFQPGLFRAGKSYRGDGYMPGSTVQGDEQKHFSPTPGFNMKVPLE